LGPTLDPKLLYWNFLYFLILGCCICLMMFSAYLCICSMYEQNLELNNPFKFLFGYKKILPFFLSGCCVMFIESGCCFPGTVFFLYGIYCRFGSFSDSKKSSLKKGLCSMKREDIYFLAVELFKSFSWILKCCETRITRGH